MKTISMQRPALAVEMPGLPPVPGTPCQVCAVRSSNAIGLRPPTFE